MTTFTIEARLGVQASATIMIVSRHLLTVIARLLRYINRNHLKDMFDYPQMFDCERT